MVIVVFYYLAKFTLILTNFYTKKMKHQTIFISTNKRMESLFIYMLMLIITHIIIH